MKAAIESFVRYDYDKIAELFDCFVDVYEFKHHCIITLPGFEPGFWVYFTHTLPIQLQSWVVLKNTYSPNKFGIDKNAAHPNYIQMCHGLPIIILTKPILTDVIYY
eukprot:90613_1